MWRTAIGRPPAGAQELVAPSPRLPLPYTALAFFAKARYVRDVATILTIPGSSVQPRVSGDLLARARARETFMPGHCRARLSEIFPLLEADGLCGRGVALSHLLFPEICGWMP